MSTFTLIIDISMVCFVAEFAELYCQYTTKLMQTWMFNNPPQQPYVRIHLTDFISSLTGFCHCLISLTVQINSFIRRFNYFKKIQYSAMFYVNDSFNIVCQKI